ncbi:MAG: hypothetical protein ACRCTZ_14695 [Sarcina sp.]
MNIAKNKKNKNDYRVVGKLINATNANDGQVMVLYFCKEGNAYVRSLEEFKEKFEFDFNMDELEDVMLNKQRDANA